MARNSYYVRPDGLHEAIRTINGKRVAFRGKTDREVGKKILEYQEKEKRGRTFSQVCDEWEREKLENMAYGTRACYKPSVKRAVNAFGEQYIREITPLEVSRFIQRFAEKGYSHQSVNVQLVVLRLIFKVAVIDGDIDADPCAYVDIPKHLPRKEREPATEEQQKAISESAPDVPQALVGTAMMWFLGYLAMYAGLRRGEALALRWEDIDTDERKIRIEKKLVWQYGKPVVQPFLKTAAGKRSVTLVEKIENILPKKRAGAIFPGKTCDWMMESEFRTAWAHYCDSIGCAHVEEVPAGKKRRDGNPIMQKELRADFTPHQLRHVYATYCYDAGVDSKAASRELGHSKESVTRDIYTHISASRERDTERKLNEFLSGKKEQQKNA
jgi:integrase